MMLVTLSIVSAAHDPSMPIIGRFCIGIQHPIQTVIFGQTAIAVNGR